MIVSSRHSKDARRSINTKESKKTLTIKVTFNRKLQVTFEAIKGKINRRILRITTKRLQMEHRKMTFLPWIC
jgi:hypothetical protein